VNSQLIIRRFTVYVSHKGVTTVDVHKDSALIVEVVHKFT